MDLSGKWCSVWTLHGHALTRKQEIRDLELHIDGELYTGEFQWRENSYSLSGRVIIGIFLTGTYEDVRGDPSYVGSFQLALLPGNDTMSGRWIGFDRRNRVLSGRWQWRRPTTKFYPFEKYANSFFMSYAHEQASIADHFEALLRRRHCVVLRDESEMVPGTSLSDSVTGFIEAANTFLVLHSKQYAASEWCRSELAYARQLRKETGRPWSIVVVDIDGTPVKPPFSDPQFMRGKERVSRERVVDTLCVDE